MRWPGLTRRVGCCSYLCLAWLYALYATWRFLQGPGSSSMNFAEFSWWTCSNYSRHFVTTPAAGLQSSGSLLALHGIGSHGRSATDLLNVVHEVLTLDNHMILSMFNCSITHYYKFLKCRGTIFGHDHHNWLTGVANVCFAHCIRSDRRDFNKFWPKLVSLLRRYSVSTGSALICSAMFSHMRTKIWDGLSRIANCDRIWQRAMFDLILLDLFGFNLIIYMQVQDGSRTISDLKNIENSIGSIRSNKLWPMMSNPPEGLQFFWSFAIQDIKASLSGRFGGGLNCWECFCLPFWSVVLLDALKFWT